MIVLCTVCIFATKVKLAIEAVINVCTFTCSQSTKLLKLDIQTTYRYIRPGRITGDTWDKSPEFLGVLTKY